MKKNIEAEIKKNMIYYDQKIDETFDIISYTFTNQSRIELTVTFHDSDSRYLDEWFSGIYNCDGSWTKPSEYKRDLFIVDKLGSHLIGCFITNISYKPNNTCVVNISSDHYISGINLASVKHIHRDKKIDQILN